LKERAHLEDLNIDGDSEMDLKEIDLENMQSINQVQKWNKWWALVNTVMITGLQKGAEDSLNG
jgi:hypothetical protein